MALSHRLPLRMRAVVPRALQCGGLAGHGSGRSRSGRVLRASSCVGVRPSGRPAPLAPSRSIAVLPSRVRSLSTVCSLFLRPVPPVAVASRPFSRPISAAESLTDLYGLLGVQKEASAEDIQRAFHRLAKKYHPDRNPGDQDIANKFAQISRAYELLSQPNTRQFYDLFVDVTAIGDRSRILHWQSLQGGTVVAPKAEFATSRMTGNTRLMEAAHRTEPDQAPAKDK